MDGNQRDPRVYFAVERTFLAWIRTGLALMGFGFVVARFGLFLREIAATSPAGLPVRSLGFSLWGGTGLVLLGVVVNVLAAIQHVHTVRDLNAGKDVAGRTSKLGLSLALVLAICGLGMAVYLIAVRP